MQIAIAQMPEHNHAHAGKLRGDFSIRFLHEIGNA